jgi:hypothetical protein
VRPQLEDRRTDLPDGVVDVVDDLSQALRLSAVGQPRSNALHGKTRGE